MNKKQRQHIAYEENKTKKLLQGYSERILKIFPDANEIRLHFLRDNISFRIEDYNEDQVNFINLAKLSKEFNTELINIRGDADRDCDTCGSDPYCEITITLKDKGDI